MSGFETSATILLILIIGVTLIVVPMIVLQIYMYIKEKRKK